MGAAVSELIYVPIVHTQADMGSLQGAVKSEFLDKYREGEWQKHTNAIQEFWKGLRKRIMGLELEYQRTHIYQDGLPVCGKELQIVTGLAQQGSQNHQLVLSLVEKGAHLVGTESRKLLLEEYELLRWVVSAPQGKPREAAAAAYTKRAPALLGERDDFIRRRIGATLPEGECGLLFIGLTHRVDEGLPSSIRIAYLIHNLPFQRSGPIRRLCGKNTPAGSAG